ncbi:hypothetical protein [Chryseobacterium sp. MEBOG07]|uniref:hypothetical protein n=1 Tax=Chryseobacterium sp. MEBOG07 TaxID=2879939 RepID=UPI001F3F26F6|nr:hypothetical protein [Chryseobacterium sp. MEBOG07]UKB79559.1 hypothetical protein LF886_00700 [Chryseobacterium sp. MEBOG07]
MAGICIIDDRVDIRETLQNRIELIFLRNNLNWHVISNDPFSDKMEYLNFIKEHDIAVLILDERLHESSGSNGSVSYNGSQLVTFLRQYLKSFPIYSVTSFHLDNDLENQFSEFDEIIARDTFYAKPEEYVARFIRAGQRFHEANSEQLLRLSILSELIAKGTATEQDLAELRVVQENLNIPFSDYGFSHRENWLNEYESNINELSTLSNDISEFLKQIEDVEKDT